MMERLVGAGLVRADQFEEAKRCVVAQKVSLDKALVLLNIISYEDLGKSLSDIYQMPYVSLLTLPPTAQVRGFMSRDCAAIWKTYPWLFDSENNLLTVAIHDVGQIEMLEKLSRFFMQPYSLAFSIASEAEIEEALVIYYGVKRRKTPFETEDASPSASQAVPGAPPPMQVIAKTVDEPRKTQLIKDTKPPAEQEQQGPEKKQLFSAEARAAQAGGRKPGDRGKQGVVKSAAEMAYPDMSKALLSAAAFVANERMSGVPGAIEKIRTRVRYCEMLGSRMNLSPVHVDGLILAAWLSAVEDKRTFIEEFSTPYRIESIIYAVDTGKGSPRPEALILSLIKCHQAFCEADPEGSKDINLTRRHMHSAWSSAPERQKMLETFLQILVDEQFLSKLDRMTGRILVVDPNERSVAMIVPPLTSHGYDVRSAPTVRAAEEMMKDFVPDLIMAEKDLQFVNGTQFCRKLKQDEKTAVIKFIMMSALRGEQHAAESLRAGADEYVVKPIDMEVLFLKVDRLLSQKDEAVKEGVAGLLKDMNFSDMIQILSAGGKNVEVVLARDKEEGHVFIQNGEIVHASAGTLSGPDAFYSLMGWQEGEFTTRRCENYPERTITVSTMSLLMEGARLLDEKKAAAVETPAVQSADEAAPVVPPVSVQSADAPVAGESAQSDAKPANSP